MIIGISNIKGGLMKEYIIEWKAVLHAESVITADNSSDAAKKAREERAKERQQDARHINWLVDGVREKR